MIGTCPKCGSVVSQVNLSPVEVIAAGGRTLNGVSYQCQECNCVLSVSIAAITSTLDSDLAKAVGQS
jgi:hypothetical protein